jgi:hypothetical protein
MSRAWLALVEDAVEGADAVARAFTPDGHPAGTLAAWRRRAKPVREARRVDERLIEPRRLSGVDLARAPSVRRATGVR